jgi:predicted PhzF superfamily epimerase YddE/YHI9
MEVPFCGHATIALGAALGERFGEGEYKLFLNQSEISVRAEKPTAGTFSATLQSPETWSKDAPVEYVDKVLAAFNLVSDSLDPRFPIRFAFAGAKHLILVVKDRETLAGMSYPFDMVKSLMAEEELVTISLLWQESGELFHSRNAFALVESTRTPQLERLRLPWLVICGIFIGRAKKSLQYCRERIWGCHPDYWCGLKRRSAKVYL